GKRRWPLFTSFPCPGGPTAQCDVQEGAFGAVIRSIGLLPPSKDHEGGGKPRGALRRDAELDPLFVQELLALGRRVPGVRPEAQVDAPPVVGDAAVQNLGNQRVKVEVSIAEGGMAARF